jgi:DNA-binding transcriptional ArsR family regulator
MSVAAFDALIHPHKRLAAMAILAASDSADFAFLRERLDVSDSDLSKQMKALQQAGYVKVNKRGRGRGASTWYRLTREGRHAFEAHVAFLQSLVTSAPVLDVTPSASKSSRQAATAATVSASTDASR